MAGVVLDANVLVSALFGGIPAAAVKKAMKGDVWISRDVEDELYGLSGRLAKKFSLDQQVRWNSEFFPLIKKMKRIEVENRVRLCRDPKDDAYLSLAKASGAAQLITGDGDLLCLTKEQLTSVGLASLSILTPKAFLEN
ncbi:putative toxin-antitoxin system toxin component, PIN family [bacterium]|nr:putative toxin-antitoxin system toxin component, PIN family [bacterium]